ncbi:hypothetical protein BD779DRAFT_1473253 [Infundibulicybe gibba]|nr:hypothetical protein BD779DRAFT_1473253 [Infundibulicybe gibba]
MDLKAWFSSKFQGLLVLTGICRHPGSLANPNAKIDTLTWQMHAASEYDHILPRDPRMIRHSSWYNLAPEDAGETTTRRGLLFGVPWREAKVMGSRKASLSLPSNSLVPASVFPTRQQQITKYSQEPAVRNPANYLQPFQPGVKGWR